MGVVVGGVGGGWVREIVRWGWGVTVKTVHNPRFEAVLHSEVFQIVNHILQRVHCLLWLNQDNPTKEYSLKKLFHNFTCGFA